MPAKVLFDKRTQTTLMIQNQKSGRKSEQVTHNSLPHDSPNVAACPVRALIWQYKHVQQHSNVRSHILGTYFDDNSTKHVLCPRTITKALQAATQALQLERFNIQADLVSSHSLRAGGATAMHMNGVPDVTIQKMGRWSSDTFLIYIKDQLAEFSRNVSSRMSRTFPLFTITPPIAPITVAT